MAITFASAHEAYIRKHVSQREGEDLRRLREGHGHAERLFLELVWWPLFGHFHDLHPEYAFRGADGRTRYLDFAFVRDGVYLAIEIDGFTTHAKNVDRGMFAIHRRRQADLAIEGWLVMPFAYDDVVQRPELCRAKIERFMGRHFGNRQFGGLALLERELLKVVLRRGQAMAPQEMQAYLGISRYRLDRIIGKLVEAGLIEPAYGRDRKRVKGYVATHRAGL